MCSSDLFFKVFGLQPKLGRSFLPEEEIPGSRRVVVISHRLWTTHFDNDSEIIGRTIALENHGRHIYEIIGVMPEGFRYPNSDVWVSIAHMPASVHRRGGDIMSIIARLKEDVTLAEAKAEMNVLQWRIYNEFKGLELYSGELKIGPHIELEPLLDSVVSGFRSSLTMFTGAVALLLLIAVANVANPLPSRALTRHRELGASAMVAQHAPLLKMAASHIAHPAIRNRGTFGGSLSHADPAAELPACAIASDALINVTSRRGDRAIKAVDFFLGIFNTALEPDEILVSVDIPVIGATERVAFAELARRRGDYAIVGLAAKGTVDGRIFRNLRLVFFSVADRPIMATETIAALEGRVYSPETVKVAEDALEADLHEIDKDLHSSAATKCHLARVLVGRVLSQLVGGKGQ